MSFEQASLSVSFSFLVRHFVRPKWELYNWTLITLAHRSTHPFRDARSIRSKASPCTLVSFLCDFAPMLCFDTDGAQPSNHILPQGLLLAHYVFTHNLFLDHLQDPASFCHSYDSVEPLYAPRRCPLVERNCVVLNKFH